MCARKDPPCWRGSRTWSFRTRRSLRTQRCGQTCRLRRRQSPSCRSGARQSRATRGSPCSSPRSAAGTGPRAAGGLCALQEGSRANGVSGRLLKLQPRKLPQPTLELVDVFLLRERMRVSVISSPAPARVSRLETPQPQTLGDRFIFKPRLSSPAP